MKKLLATALISLMSIFAFYGQSSENVIFYGIDFSQVKVYAADESVGDFENVFKSINLLIMEETTKYDFSKVVSSDIDYNFEPIIKKIEEADFDDLKILKNSVPELNVEKIVKNYKLPEKKGKGLVVIPQTLNKATASADSYVILFDIDTRKIIKQEYITTKAGGFGLRNFWARPFFYITLKVKL